MSTIKLQQGATLIVTLILLFILLMVGVSAVRISLVEEKMTGNLRDKHIAFEAAESALVAAEDWVFSQQNYPTPNASGSNHVWSSGGLGYTSWWKNNTVSWWASNGVVADGNTMQYAQPRYVIEELSFSQKGENLTIGLGEVKQGKYNYQVTTRGHGGGSETRVHLRTTYVKRYD